MKTIFRHAGVPVRAIALVPEALKMCTECKRYELTGTMPATSMSIVLHFNAQVYADIVFIDDWMFAIYVDRATRYTVFAALTSKTFEAL